MRSEKIGVKVSLRDIFQIIIAAGAVSQSETCDTATPHSSLLTFSLLLFLRPVPC